MRKEASNLSCAEFQAQLPELIGSGTRIAEHEHLRTCDNCRALLADLETIAEAARQLFPVVEPPDDLWEQIETAMRNEGATADSR
jgi:predicted anti-sigma-YlaC factor YlaD